MAASVDMIFHIGSAHPSRSNTRMVLLIEAVDSVRGLKHHALFLQTPMTTLISSSFPPAAARPSSIALSI